MNKLCSSLPLSGGCSRRLIHPHSSASNVTMALVLSPLLPVCVLFCLIPLLLFTALLLSPSLIGSAPVGAHILLSLCFTRAAYVSLPYVCLQMQLPLSVNAAHITHTASNAWPQRWNWRQHQWAVLNDSFLETTLRLRWIKPKILRVIAAALMKLPSQLFSSSAPSPLILLLFLRLKPLYYRLKTVLENVLWNLSQLRCFASHKS